jgi:hypothetical protein
VPVFFFPMTVSQVENELDSDTLYQASNFCSNHLAFFPTAMPMSTTGASEAIKIPQIQKSLTNLDN